MNDSTKGTRGPDIPVRRRLASASSGTGGTRLPIWVIWAIGLPLLAVSLMLSLSIGSRPTSLIDAAPRALDALRYAADPNFAASMAYDEITVLMGQLRVPRSLLAVVAGAGLGVAGTIIQGHTRNPLADPGILGINAGAAAAVVAAVYFGIASTPSGYVWPAVIGCAVVTIAVFALSSTGSTAGNPLTIILAGSAISALMMAFVNAVVISNQTALSHFREWATGSVTGRGMDVVWAVLPLFLVGMLICLFQGRALNLLSLGEPMAKALGLHVTRARTIGLGGVSLLGGAAVASAGPVAFIGLAAPHIIRSISGPDYRTIIPAAALLGGLLALWADILGRLIARPGEVGMGIVLAIVGVPFFIFLIKKGRVITL